MRGGGWKVGIGSEGLFNSHGGSQFVESNPITAGGPINLDSISDNRLPARVCELPDSILSSHFTGRGNELGQIDRAFSSSSDDLPTRCVIHGMPGVGKTQLALRYAKLASERSEDMYTFWLSAGSTEKLARDFAKLVDILRLPGWCTLDQATKLTVARAWLEDPTVGKKWLLVLDNVRQETTTILLDDILPRRNGRGSLLCTTRTAEVAELCTISGQSLMIALQTPGIDDAVAMLAAGAGVGEAIQEKASYADLKRLVRSVGNLPLAIDQAASYIKGYGSNMKEMLDLYKSEEIVEVLSWENDLSRYEEKSVVATFMPGLEKISQTAPDSVILLRILCFCDPENIPISIFKQGCDVLSQEDGRDLPTASAINELEAVIDLFRSPIRLSKAIQEIQRLSLAIYTSKQSERIIRMHDLVQLLLRSKLIAVDEREQWLEVVICIVCKAFDKIGDRKSPENWSRCGQFVSHIEFMEGFAENYGLCNTILLDACMWAAIYFNECGLYQKAASMQKRTWERRKAVLGLEHPLTVVSMGNLALAYLNQGRWKEAEELHLAVIERKKRVLGEEHPYTLNCMNNLAVTYLKQARWEEAEELGVTVIEMTMRVLGEGHILTLSTLDNLAMTYWNQGRWKEAEELHMVVVQNTKRVLGEEHPDTVRSMHNLACIWKSQGQNAKAIDLMGECVNLRTRMLGANHPSTLFSSTLVGEWQVQDPALASSAMGNLDSKIHQMGRESQNG